jgi:serine/threonine protein phosphatase 1
MAVKIKGRRFAIGDVHGCAKTLQYMFEEELKATKEDLVILLGDYIDRGPDSKGVLDYIIKLKEDGYNIETLRGNHEEMLLEAIANPEERLEVWLINGGEESLKSFGIKSVNDLSAKYINFFNNLKYYIELDDFFLVHAGFNFTGDKPFEDTYSMVWIRNMKIDKKALGGKRIIHGHTPTACNIIQQTLADETSMEINLDSGCVYNNNFGLGHLAALNLDSLELHLVKNREKMV